MKLEVVSQKKNPLMEREEVLMRIHHADQRTPSRHEVAKAAASHLKTSESLIIVDRIITMQGQTMSQAKILAYEKSESIPAYMLEKMKKRTKGEAEEKKEGGKPPSKADAAEKAAA